MVGDEFGHILGQVEVEKLRLALDDGHAGLETGGWTSAVRPHSKRVRRRSSRLFDLLGRAVGCDDDLLVGIVELKVWKNSSWVDSLPAMNWMSSTSSRSATR